MGSNLLCSVGSHGFDHGLCRLAMVLHWNATPSWFHGCLAGIFVFSITIAVSILAITDGHHGDFCPKYSDCIQSNQIHVLAILFGVWPIPFVAFMSSQRCQATIPVLNCMSKWLPCSVGSRQGVFGMLSWCSCTRDRWVLQTRASDGFKKPSTNVL